MNKLLVFLPLANFVSVTSVWFLTMGSSREIFCKTVGRSENQGKYRDELVKRRVYHVYGGIVYWGLWIVYLGVGRN